jgi:hypothetical protein
MRREVVKIVVEGQSIQRVCERERAQQQTKALWHKQYQKLSILLEIIGKHPLCFY